MARTRYRRASEDAKSHTPPSPEFVAARSERLAGYVADGAMLAEDLAALVEMSSSTPGQASGEPVYVGRLREIGLTIIEFSRKAAIVVCPHCGDRRRVTQGTVADRWIRNRRVPQCGMYGYQTCEPVAGDSKP